MLFVYIHMKKWNVFQVLEHLHLAYVFATLHSFRWYVASVAVVVVVGVALFAFCTVLTAVGANLKYSGECVSSS